MKHVELEQFLHAFTSRGFDSVSWAFLFNLTVNKNRGRLNSQLENYLSV